MVSTLLVEFVNEITLLPDEQDLLSGDQRLNFMADPVRSSLALLSSRPSTLELH